MKNLSDRKARQRRPVRYPDLPEFVWKGPVFLLGLTGGIASGKSFAAEAFRECGAVVLDADLLAREALGSEELRPALRKLFFGHPEIEKHGQVDRSAIASLVFSRPALLEGLNALVHPLVQQRFRKSFQALPVGSLCVYDVPLLFEASDPAFFDAVLVISAPVEVRLKRAQARSNWSKEEFLRREARQIPLSEKEKLADLVIENTCGPAFLGEAIRKVCTVILQNRPAL